MVFSCDVRETNEMAPMHSAAEDGDSTSVS